MIPATNAAALGAMLAPPRSQGHGKRAPEVPDAKGLTSCSVLETAPIPLANSGGERGEARDAGGGARDRVEPGAETAEVDRGGGRHVLQVGLGQAAVAAAAQAEGAHPLRDGTLDAGPPGVDTTPRLGRELPARRPERLVLGPGWQLQVAGPGARARGPRRARAAVGLTEQHTDVGTTAPLDPLAPARGQPALGAS